MLTIVLLLINSSESLQVTGCNLLPDPCNIVIVFVFPIQSAYFKVNLKILSIFYLNP